MITDFVIANVEEAPAVLATQLPASRWKVLSGWKGLDPVKLQTLAAIAAGAKGQPIPTMKTPLLGSGQGGSPLLLEVGAQFRDLIASLTPADFNTVADSWLMTDELKMDGWSKQEATAFVRDINKLAATARKENKNLLLWMLF